MTSYNAGCLRQFFVFFLLENQLRYLLSHLPPHFVLIWKEDLCAKRYQKPWRYQEKYFLLQSRCQTIDNIHGEVFFSKVADWISATFTKENSITTAFQEIFQFFSRTPPRDCFSEDAKYEHGKLTRKTSLGIVQKIFKLTG